MLLAYQDRFPVCEKDVFIAPGAWVIGDVRIGCDSSVFFNTVVRGDTNSISIGDRTNIQDNCTLHVTRATGLLVGNGVTVGHNAVLHGCTIADNVLIGMGAIVLDGACIGEGSIVAAGSLVAPGKQFPAGSVIVGSPAKVIRSLTESDKARIQTAAANYLKVKDCYRAGKMPAGGPGESDQPNS